MFRLHLHIESMYERTHTYSGDDPQDNSCPVLFSTIAPVANNSERSKQGREQHATPSWARLTSGDKQAGKMRGENSTKEARKEVRE
jgi:hypothetical protein